MQVSGPSRPLGFIPGRLASHLRLVRTSGNRVTNVLFSLFDRSETPRCADPVVGLFTDDKHAVPLVIKRLAFLGIRSGQSETGGVE
ncbi:hypothetical protein VTI74DRAFT_6591 [Chaetomium olivicolor]